MTNAVNIQPSDTRIEYDGQIVLAAFAPHITTVSDPQGGTQPARREDQVKSITLDTIYQAIVEKLRADGHIGP